MLRWSHRQRTLPSTASGKNKCEGRRNHITLTVSFHPHSGCSALGWVKPRCCRIFSGPSFVSFAFPPAHGAGYCCDHSWVCQRSLGLLISSPSSSLKSVFFLVLLHETTRFWNRLIPILLGNPIKYTGKRNSEVLQKVIGVSCKSQDPQENSFSYNASGIVMVMKLQNSFGWQWNRMKILTRPLKDINGKIFFLPIFYCNMMSLIFLD